METIVYALEPGLSPEEFIDVLRRSTLAERRPVSQAETIAGMLARADVIVTARVVSAALASAPAGGLLVGVARALTDFSYCAYLSDLAVDERYQGRGVGRALLRRAHEAAGPQTTLILLAAPRARDYYPKVGMRRHDSCWIGDPGWLADPASPGTETSTGTETSPGTEISPAVPTLSDSPVTFRTLRGLLRGEEPDEENHFHYVATLRVFGENLPLDEITQRLGVRPTMRRRRGDRRHADAIPARDDAWHYTPPVPETEPFEAHLRALLDVARPRLDYLKQLKTRYRLDVFCGYRSNCDHAGFEIPHPVLELFAALELPLSVSVIVT